MPRLAIPVRDDVPEASKPILDAGAYPYKRDLPKVEFHLIDTGHFALEDKADEMVPLIRDFLNRKIAS